MLRAKLLNRSGWKKRMRQGVLLTLLAGFPAIGNAQQGTGSASQVVQKTSAPEAADSATTAISSTKTNQQSQHRVSVAPQGGELDKRTGAATWDFTETEADSLAVTVFPLPPVSPPHGAYLYLDRHNNKLMMSINGGPWEEMKGTCEQSSIVRQMLGGGAK